MTLSKSFATGQILTAEDVNTHLVNHVPNPGDPYDTDWVPVPADIGEISPVEVRRSGMNVYLRGIPDGAAITSSGYTRFGTLPAEFRPPRTYYFPVLTNSFNVIHRFRVGADGAMEVDVGTSARRFYLDSVSFLVG